MTDENKKNQECKCPFCDGEIEEKELPFCSSCNTPIKYCKNCGTPIPSEVNNCPECGQS
jgi:predicted amidophosphoribosyltransferase